MKQKGFTIVELLIVIVVIGILATISIVAYNGVQASAQQAKVSQELAQLKKSIKLLEADTSKGTYGCPAGGAVHNPEGQVSDAKVGLMTRPTVGSWNGTDTICVWSQAEVDAWNGPYFATAQDPWGSVYYVDNDYGICQGESLTYIAVILSAGPNKGINYPASGTTPCTTIEVDDQYIPLK